MRENIPSRIPKSIPVRANESVYGKRSNNGVDDQRRVAPIAPQEPRLEALEMLVAEVVALECSSDRSIRNQRDLVVLLNRIEPVAATAASVHNMHALADKVG